MGKLNKPGFILFGVALSGLGIIQLVTQNFLVALLPFKEIPLQIIWVLLTSLLFISTGVLFILQKNLRYALLTVAVVFFLFFLYPHLPIFIKDVHNGSEWTVAIECLVFSSGAYLIGAVQGLYTTSFTIAFGVIARYVFALCLIVFGLQHFIYADFLKTLMPAWIPLKEVWSQVIRYGFLLAAISLIINYQVKLSMTLLGVMFLLWVIVLHLPRCIEKFTAEDEWASLLIALAMSGMSFCIADAAIHTEKTVSNKSFIQQYNDL